MRTILLSILQVVIFFSALPQIAFAFNPAQETTDQLLEIKKQYEAKQYEAVIQKGAPYVNDTPNDIDAYLYIALSYYQLKQYLESQNYFNAMLKIQPDNIDGITGLIHTQIAMENFNQAFITTEKGLDFFPKNPILLELEDKLQPLVDNDATEETIRVMRVVMDNIHLNKTAAPAIAATLPKPDDTVERTLNVMGNIMTTLLPKSDDLNNDTVTALVAHDDMAAAIRVMHEVISSMRPTPQDWEKMVALTEEEMPPKKIPGKKTGSEIDIQDVKKWYKNHQYKKIITKALAYLDDYPEDSDVRLYLAFAYHQLQKYETAVKNFNIILKTTPDNKDAANGLLRSLARQRLAKSNPAILNDRKEPDRLKAHIENFRIRRPGLAETNSDSIRDKAHYVLTANSLNAHVNKPEQFWDWSSLFISRKNQYGSFSGGVNYASRLGRGSIQGMIDLQPRLSSKTWVDLTYAGANNPYLFPGQEFRGEVFTLITPHIQTSIGNDFRNINGKSYFNTILGSVGIYVNNYFIGFTPKVFHPNDGPNSSLFTLTGTRYSVNNPDKYLSIFFSGGTSPDLFNLETIDFIRVRERILFLQGQEPISDTLLILYGVGMEKQIFPNHLKRVLSYGNIGLAFRFL